MSGLFSIMSSASITIACIIIGATLAFPSCGVIHGIPTAPFEFPELARLYRCNFLRCTATILNRQWLMTSAYCFVDQVYRIHNLSDFFVNVGDHNSSVRESSEQNLSVVDIVLYDKYRRGHAYDLLLFRVQPDIKFGATVRPVNMVTCKQSAQPGTKLTLVGYGEYMNDTYKQYSAVPRKGEVQTLTFKDCQKSLCGGIECDFDIPKSILCSSNKDGLIGPCNGDPGAPVFFIKEDGARIMAGQTVGTVGGGPGKCHINNYLYTDLAPFVGWIHRRISDCGNYPKNRQLNYDKPANTVPCT